MVAIQSLTWQMPDLRFLKRERFAVTLAVSLLLHVLVLCVSFAMKTDDGPHVFSDLKIRLEPYDKQQESLSQMVRLAQRALAPVPAQPEVRAAEEAKHDAVLFKELAPSAGKNSYNITKKEAASVSKPKSVPKRAVRQALRAMPAVAPRPKPVPGGSMLGNSHDPDAQQLTRYEQLLPLWINRFKRYPAVAKQMGLEGKGVVYLQIDRKGDVLDARIAKSTGHPLLDSALLKMVRDASPVIPVPASYGVGQNAFSYQIEFSFTLDDEGSATDSSGRHGPRS